MSKKLIMASMAAAAFAAFVVLPATASASPRLCETATGGGEPCTNVGVGAKVTATNTGLGNTKFLTDPASGKPTTLVECTSAHMVGEVHVNNGTQIEADITTATFSEGGGEGEINGMKECKGTFGPVTPTANGNNVDNENVANGTPWCVKSSGGGTDNFTIRGGLCSQAARTIRFILDATFTANKVTECAYERGATEPIKGTFRTDSAPENSDAVLSVTATETNKTDTTFKGAAGNNILCPATGTLEMGLTLVTNETSIPLYIK